ncbi:1-acyl-sn-glycerol-3-phosphate acyltransferase [Aestuariicella hydrocarbonica]|uniref:1-acyl-sn-glycerol-3-phosphate acyltransferase n=1 Tax=Pseudomaricurvus hydrocarbonicus TaxID=1470433 RepID=A0A9E5MPD1_9GAMM|nr:lysophospholipid acyltransferase family protein [Aestuariicella hydrocarbonica]NHO67930.1 1-acyl-sn-glycerol-3-phosphate acyltransferase [Aestuariicella hydrocarbonica]
MQVARAIAFYAFMSITAIVFGVIGIVMPLTPYRFRSRFFISFNRVMLWALKHICGVTCRVRGMENLPQGQPFVIMAKHQSTWEAIFFQWFFHPTSIILKKELLKIPFFGWGLAQCRPIAIDRSNPKEALKKVKTYGQKRLDEGNNVLVFPEGTRTPVGKAGNYARSGADIAINASAPLIPVAHNAGVYWPMKKWLKNPGTIEVVIGAAIATEGRTSKVVTAEAKDWIEAEVAKMAQQSPVH